MLRKTLQIISLIEKWIKNMSDNDRVKLIESITRALLFVQSPNDNGSLAQVLPCPASPSTTIA